MSEGALLKRFDLIADNPENMPLLRHYIVDLAIRGKLLERSALDISAPVMLKRIEEKSYLLIKQGKLKKQKPLLPISAEELPATYIDHCMFERLGNIANLQKGLTGIQSSTSGDFKLVVTSANRSTCDHYDFEGAAAIIPMVSSTGHGHASLNRLHYEEGKFALGTILCAVFPIDEELISARFLFEYLTAFKSDLLVSKMNGTANVTLTISKIAEVPVPIIAPAVQRRVNELMLLCDQLQAAQGEREKRRDRLVAASLFCIDTDFTKADEVETGGELNTPLSEAARFHLTHITSLTTRPEHIKQLRQTILSLAVRGRLVSQEPDDEPATILIKQIAVAMDSKKSLLSTADFDAPFTTPDGWAWVKLGVICSKTGSGSTPSGGKDAYIKKGIPFLRSQNIYDDGLRLSNVAFISDETHQRMKNTSVMPGDLLLNITGGSIGRCAIVPDNFKLGNINQHVAIVRLALKELNAFNHLMIISPYFQNEIFSSLTGAGREGLPKKRMDEILIPMPPLAEQKRIVTKVIELMKLCDQLEAQLKTIQTVSRRFLEALLSEASLPIEKSVELESQI